MARTKKTTDDDIQATEGAVEILRSFVVAIKGPNPEYTEGQIIEEPDDLLKALAAQGTVARYVGAQSEGESPVDHNIDGGIE